MKLLATAIVFFIVSLAAPTGAEEPDAEYIAELYFDAQSARLPFPDILKINPDLSETLLYEVQRRFVAKQREHGATIGGFKGGFIPKAPIGGVLFSGGFLRGSPALDRRNFQGLLVEAEIAFQICRPLSAPLADVSALKSATCKVFPAIELPDAALPDLDGLRQDFAHLRRLLIPTNMAVSHVLIGEPRDPGDLDLDHLDIKVTLDGKEIGFRDGKASRDDIWSRVLWVINDFVLARAYTLEPGHIVIPGALTGLHPGKPGGYSVDYGALGRVAFEIR